MTIMISKEICEKAGEEIKELFISNYKHMRKAFQNIEGNLSVGLNCTWKPSRDHSAIDSDIGISFKIDEIKKKSTFTFTEGSGNGEIFDMADKQREKLREILFRDFRPFAKTLYVQKLSDWLAAKAHNPLLVKRFA